MVWPATRVDILSDNESKSDDHTRTQFSAVAKCRAVLTILQGLLALSLGGSHQ